MILISSQDMMKNLKKNLIDNYANALSTLKKCSYDSENGVYLCNSEEAVYDFDIVKEQYCKHMCYEDMTSMDSLILVEKQNSFFLVEFKNKEKLPYKDIRAKVHESLFIMENNFQISRDFFSMIELIVVYNPPKKRKKSLQRIRLHFKELAGGEHDEIQHFKMFKDRYNMKSLKFSTEDFLEYLDICS